MEKDKTLSTKELCKRWGITQITLLNWRNNNTGPAYFKIGEGKIKRIRYKLEDVIAYENK